MSDDNDDGWIDLEDGEPDLAEEDGRDAWINAMLESDEWVSAQVVHDGKNMVARFRWNDGSEEVFDLVIRRKMALVRSTSPEGSN